MTILCYHAVDPDWRAPMSVDPADFAHQAAWLATHRTVLPLDRALERLDRSCRLPRGSVALTFDDGFSSVYEHALGVLRRHRLPATVFLVAESLTAHGRAVDWVRSQPSFPLRTLTRDQVLEMQDAGIDFQSHSWAHQDLPGLDPDACEQDLRDSRGFLEDLLGRPVTSLAYPRGLHDQMVRTAAERAGYRHALTLPERSEPTGPYAVPRVGVHGGNSLAELRIKCARSYLPLRHHRALATLRTVVARPRARTSGADER